ncbi:aminopeptidase I zinc metalloprotease (M18) [Bulleidia extructa W1219]|uniref:M18 family aminopeptidase n=1 Tax=Bulleidia extructa W1219 TaxID=679192 RepID=D2MN90_9FIRM|nr:aminopeptidase [Bulleidia extructa]EFC05912.1 aminopeptidase I zinc metalloprotease (M18) [Bulleidia extructa W1219]
MKTVWEKLDKDGVKAVMDFNEEYRQFLTKSKTERTFVTNTEAFALENGFKSFDSFQELKAGDRVYVVNRKKNIMMLVVGEEPMNKGVNVLGAHIDSPRMDLKQKPLYEKDGIAFFDTHYYGGIKKYQWVARPLALVGVVAKKDGTVVDINIGDKPGDPVVGVSDLLIHLAQKQLQKTGATVIEGEKLDLTVASRPKKEVEEEAVKAFLLDLLQEQYGIDEEDFLSAEIEVVPAGEARDYGLDRSMILGYGHDDKVCAYTSVRAINEIKTPKRTSVLILTDKEEIGSVGATGAHSDFFEHVMVRALEKQGFTKMTDLYDLYENSYMLSIDVSAGYDSNYAEAFEARNSAYLGKGVCFNKYTGARGKSGSNDASAEFMAKVRKVMDENDVVFQTAELGAVDVGGGGTIAYILAEKNMDVIDAGIAVQNMHAPDEVVSKVDVYEAYRAYFAFLKDMQ